MKETSIILTNFKIKKKKLNYITYINQLAIKYYNIQNSVYYTIIYLSCFTYSKVKYLYFDTNVMDGENKWISRTLRQ